MNIAEYVTRVITKQEVRKSKCSDCGLLIICFFSFLILVLSFLLANYAIIRNEKKLLDDINDDDNYNDNYNDKNNYNVKIIHNCRSTIAIFNLLLLSLHGGLVKVYLLLLCTLLPSHQPLEQTINSFVTASLLYIYITYSCRT